MRPTASYIWAGGQRRSRRCLPEDILGVASRLGRISQVADTGSGRRAEIWSLSGLDPPDGV